MDDTTVPKRRFPRLTTRQTVLLRALEGSGIEEFAPTRTLALGGCSVLSDQPIGVGCEVEMLISLHQEVVRAHGRVVYEHPAEDGRLEIGVAFLQLEDQAAEAIRKLFVTQPQ